MINSAKFLSPLLGLTVFLTGIGQSSLNAQLMPHSSDSLIAQTLNTEDNEMLVEKSLTMLDLLRGGKYQEARELLSPEVAGTLSKEEIAAFWQTLTKKWGTIKQYNDTDVINTLDANVVIVNTQFSNAEDENIVVTYNDAGQIVGVNFVGLETVEEIAEGFVQSLITRDYNAARINFHPFLKRELFSAQIQEQWEGVIKAHGKAQRIEDITVVPGFGSASGKLVEVTVKFEKRTDDVLIIFDDNLLITGIDMAVD